MQHFWLGGWHGCWVAGVSPAWAWALTPSQWRAEIFLAWSVMCADVWRTELRCYAMLTSVCCGESGKLLLATLHAKVVAAAPRLASPVMATTMDSACSPHRAPPALGGASASRHGQVHAHVPRSSLPSCQGALSVGRRTSRMQNKNDRWPGGLGHLVWTQTSLPACACSGRPLRSISQHALGATLRRLDHVPPQ